jgi:hypothetical protein
MVEVGGGLSRKGWRLTLKGWGLTDGDWVNREGVGNLIEERVMPNGSLI